MLMRFGMMPNFSRKALSSSFQLLKTEPTQMTDISSSFCYSFSVVSYLELTQLLHLPFLVVKRECVALEHVQPLQRPVLREGLFSLMPLRETVKESISSRKMS